MNINANEFKNFNENNSLNFLPSGNKFLIYDVHLGNEKPEENYHEILKVIFSIISASRETWPNENVWRKLFSESFNAHFPDLTREECDEMLKEKSQKKWDELPWDFGSWLDVIKRRSWIWVAHEKKGRFINIALFVNSSHAGDLEAFDEIFKACGSKIVRRESVMF